MASSDAAAIRRDYVRRLVALKLWHVWRLHKDGIDLRTALTERVDLCRMSTFIEGTESREPLDAEGWQRVLDELAAVYARHDADATSGEIEAEGGAALAFA